MFRRKTNGNASAKPKKERKVLGFWRGARRHPKWDLGAPPNPRDNHRRGGFKSRWADPRFYLKAVVVISAVGFLSLTIVADAAQVAFGAKSENGCRVISVVDGDTIRLWCPGRGTEKVRLVGIDAPEVFSPKCSSELRAGMTATWALRRLLFTSNDLTVVRRGVDRYDRTLAFLAVDDVPVARQMVENGYARVYSGGVRRGWCA